MSIETNLIASTSSASPTTVYTSTGESAVTTIFFCNTDSSSIDVTVWIVPSGDTLGDEHMIMKELTINATDTFAFGSERILMGASDTIQAIAGTTNKVSVVISYTSI
tara:strand:- start:293 stop:613 length:321 start_codon:yes stop_codon:yes gene_type:complete